MAAKKRSVVSHKKSRDQNLTNQEFLNMNMNTFTFFKWNLKKKILCLKMAAKTSFVTLRKNDHLC